MIPSLNSAENFVKSRFALLAFLLVVASGLAAEVVRLNTLNAEREQEFTKQLAVKDGIIFQKDSILYDCQQQAKTNADNQVNAAKQLAEDYRLLWLDFIQVKTEVKNLKK